MSKEITGRTWFGNISLQLRLSWRPYRQVHFKEVFGEEDVARPWV